MVHGQDEDARHMQLMLASGDTMSTINDQSSVMGSTPATNGSSSQGTASQGANRPSWQGLQIHKSGTIHTHNYAQTNKYMYDCILLRTCPLINISVINPLCAMCTKSILQYPL